MLVRVYEFLADDKTRNLFVILGVFVAIISIATSRALARKKQAADLLFASRNDDKLQKAARCIEKHHDANDRNIRALAAKGRIEEEEPTLIRHLLNHFELISVGIQNGIYDERMIKESWCGIIVRTYDQSLPFIQACREQNARQTLYQELEWLALRWKKDPLTVKTKLQYFRRVVFFWQ